MTPVRVVHFWSEWFPDSALNINSCAQLLNIEVEHSNTSGSDIDYWLALGQYWWNEWDLIVVEQDILVHGMVLPEFISCDKPWCTFPYKHGRATRTHSLGCTKFSAELMDEVPFPHEPVHWRGLSTSIKNLCLSRGYQPHIHGPAVGHIQ